VVKLAAVEANLDGLIKNLNQNDVKMAYLDLITELSIKMKKKYFRGGKNA
jgi:hypothetical protein